MRKLDTLICDGLRIGTEKMLESLWEFCDERPSKMARNLYQLKTWSQQQVEEELKRMCVLYKGLEDLMMSRDLQPLFFMQRYLRCVADNRKCKTGAFLAESVVGSKQIIRDLYNETLTTLGIVRPADVVTTVSQRTWTHVPRDMVPQTEVSVLPSDSVSNVFASGAPRDMSGGGRSRYRVNSGDVPLSKEAVEALPDRMGSDEEEGGDSDYGRYDSDGGEHRHSEFFEEVGPSASLRSGHGGRGGSEARFSGGHAPPSMGGALANERKPFYGNYVYPSGQAIQASESMAPPPTTRRQGGKRRAYVGPVPSAPRQVPTGSSRISYQRNSSDFRKSPPQIVREPSLQVRRTPSRLSRAHYEPQGRETTEWSENQGRDLASDVFEPLSSITLQHPSATRSEWYSKHDGHSDVFDEEDEEEEEGEEKSLRR